MNFKVTRQYGTGSEQDYKTFNELKIATQFAEEQAHSDAAMKIKVIYRVYDFDDIKFEINSSNLPDAKSQAESAQGSQGKQTGSSFSPTPFNTSPRPSGTPHGWVKDEEEKKK